MKIIRNLLTLCVVGYLLCLTPAQSSEIKETKISATALAGNAFFGKDTDSPIFMLMKSWECEKSDGVTFLESAIASYGKDAEKVFKVKGLSRLPKFMVSIKKIDITLDELLDLLAQKYCFTWGVDIQGKTIHFYPLD